MQRSSWWMARRAILMVALTCAAAAPVWAGTTTGGATGATASAPAAASATPATPSGAAGAPTAADAKVDLDHELRTVEEQVDALKERVFRSKATLQLLQEIVAEQLDSGAAGVFWYENALGRTYTVERIAYLLDGETRFSKEDTTGALNATKELKVVQGPLSPGTHNLLVEVRLRPTGFGLFQYARSYTIDVRSSYSFEADVGKTCSVRSVLNDKGGSARSLDERARIDFELSCERNADATPQK